MGAQEDWAKKEKVYDRHTGESGFKFGWLVGHLWGGSQFMLDCFGESCQIFSIYMLESFAKRNFSQDDEKYSLLFCTCRQSSLEAFVSGFYM